MQNDMVVTGIGLISALGQNVTENLIALREGRSGIDEIALLQTNHRGTFKVGEVKCTNESLRKRLGISEQEAGRYTRTTLLGLSAVREACENAGLDLSTRKRTGLISATTVGGMDQTELVYQTSTDGEFVKTHPCGDATTKIADMLGLNGYRTTISTACSSAANAVMHAARLIRQGVLERAVVGGVDALSRFTLNGFNALMILDREFCKPFDQNRKGLNLGEGAGFIVLESAAAAERRGQKVLCRLSGYANANDAYHQTASSPEGEGAYLAMSQALAMSGLATTDISYVNVHGTGTPNNDLSEGTALQRLFTEKMPLFSSTKAFTGHTLAAAAGVEAVFSVLALQQQLIFPNLNFETPIEGVNLYPQTTLLSDCDVRHVMSNSFGFGGNNSTLIFSR